MSLSDTEVNRFEHVLTHVRGLCRPPVDVENLAGQIVMEYLGRPLSYTIIRNRCYDELRRLRREKAGLEAYSQIDPQTVPPFDDEQLGRIILATDLTGLERKVLYMIYVEGLSMGEISKINWHSVREVSDAQYSALEKLKETARSIYG